ncbi:MFS transporter [Hominibacterium faecale]|uniref:MFS transporter n=1 Tax=Hominibacterium faecale TaxID=2839743 RepID=UPI0022B2981C|nr:MFS transporter [Hominibacterium faecale]
MSKNTAKTNLMRLAVLSIAVVGSMNCFMIPALAVIADAFPEASPTAIQMIMTFAMIGQFPMSVTSGFAGAKISQKKLLLFGVICIIAGGAMPMLLHGSIIYLYIGSLFMGIGQGIALTLMGSLINTLFTGKMRSQLLGWQNTVTMITLILISMLGGALASIQWTYIYLISFLGIPTLIFIALWLPKENPHSTEEELAENADLSGPKANRILSVPVILLLAFIFFFEIGFASINVNAAMLIEDRNIGGGAAWVAGLMSSFSYLISMVSGILYVYILKLSKEFILVTSAVSMTIGLFLSYASYSVFIYAVAQTFIFFGYSIGIVGGMEMVGRFVKPEWVSSCMGVFWGFDCIGTMVEPYLVNSITKFFSGEVTPGGALFVGGIFMAVTIVIAIILGMKGRSNFMDLKKKTRQSA